MTWLHENCVPGKSKLVWCLNLGSVDFQFCACNILLICFSSAQSCPTLCGPMDCSTPGLPVRHQLSELTQTHPVSQWCHPTISSSVVPFSSRLQSFPASGSFQMSQFFASGGQSIGVSASGLISFRMDWLDLLAVQGTLKGLLQQHRSKALILWCSAFFILQLSHPHDYWKNHSFH